MLYLFTGIEICIYLLVDMRSHSLPTIAAIAKSPQRSSPLSGIILRCFPDRVAQLPEIVAAMLETRILVETSTCGGE